MHDLQGDYSQNGKVTLVRRLVRGGLLRVVQEEGGDRIPRPAPGVERYGVVR
jgi:hypothetical protein